jgi:glycosidase
MIEATSAPTPVPLPDWVAGRTLYHLHALGAAAGRGLGHLTWWLDHVADLGAGAVLLTPIHRSTSHGYDTIDASALDPRLGTDEDLDAFLAACRERDLRVVLDAVLNHVGLEFPRRDWLSGRSFEGHDELPELDHEDPEVLEWAIASTRSWLDRGVDGWRFDVAYRIPRPFLAAVTAALREAHPDALLFGEMIHGDQGGFAAATGLHGMTQYELYKAIWSACNDGNLWELAWALDRHAGFCASSTPVTFVGNHDVTRLASRLHDRTHAELALAVIATVPGIPCTYYGDELGWTGVKEDRAGGDDAIRQPLPDARPGADDQLVPAHRRWLGFRRDHPELTRAPIEVLDKANRRLSYRVGDVTVTLDLDHGASVG